MTDPRGVDVDADHVYWTNANGPESVGRANLDRSGVNQTFITPAPEVFGPTDVAVDAGHVYWTNGSGTSPSIGRANLDGSGADQSFIAASGPYPSYLAVDASHIYWTTGSNGEYSIARANLDGSAVELHFIDLPAPSPPFGLAIDSGHIYWSDGGAIDRANLDGTGIETNFIDVRAGAYAVGVDAGHVYFANYSIGNEITYWIGRANLDGSEVNQDFFATGRTPVVDIATDPGHIYWATQEVHELPPHGEEPQPPADPPKTLLVQSPPDRTHKTKATFGFSSNDLSATFECRLDDKGWKPCLSPKTLKHLSAGRHKFRVRARTETGGADATPAKYTFRVVG
jgi:hypothetical protein